MAWGLASGGGSGTQVRTALAKASTRANSACCPRPTRKISRDTRSKPAPIRSSVPVSSARPSRNVRKLDLYERAMVPPLFRTRKWALKTKRVLDPFRFLLIAVSGWMNQRQLQVIDYLREEKRVLREQHGDMQLRFDDHQRRRLLVFCVRSLVTLRRCATDGSASGA